MASTEGSAAEYRTYREKRLRDRVRRWRKMWRIYYGSRYGKIGFWLLIGFAVMTLLSPILTFHDPYTFIAPREDSWSATQELGAQLPYSAVVNGMPLEPTAVPITSAGSYVVYTTTADGNVSAVGLGATPSTAAGEIFHVFSPNWAAGSTVFAASVFALANYTTFQSAFSFDYSEYLLEGATHANSSTIDFAPIHWSGPQGPGDGSPSAYDAETLTIPGTLVAPPVSSSTATSIIPSWGPFAQSSAYTSGGLKAAYVYTVTRSASGFNLSEFYAMPLQWVWSVHLTGTAVPEAPQYLGSYYAPPAGTEDTAVLVAQGSTLSSYNPGNGKLRWAENLSAPILPDVGIVVPFLDQDSFSAADVLFLGLAGSPGSVVDANLTSGAITTVTTVPGGVDGVATSGDAGYPTYVCVVSPTTVYMLNGPKAVANSADGLGLPQGSGTYETDPLYDQNSNLMIVSTSTGLSIAINAALGTDPIQWKLAPNPLPSAISPPLLVYNALKGGLAVAFVTSGSILDLYSTVGTDDNPLPPEFHTPSGNIYVFGTNSAGNDVWSQFVASFVWDWEIGLAVAAGIILVSVLVAMFIGYVGNWAAAVVETLTLVLFLLPGLALLIVVASIVGASFVNTLLVLTFVSWPFTAITLIGVVRQIKSRTFIEAARVSGASTVQILRRHMLPNMTPLLAYFTALSIGGAATAFSTLQFLGIAQLTIPTWGGMLQPMLDNFYFALEAPWWIWPPTIALTMFVFAFVFVSRGMDEVVNPRLRAR
ncbi:MAG: ABC transporter permease [Thermoplasmata archaeon]|nr:ABC transporter permease [Thermoplasmata archaeon]